MNLIQPSTEIATRLEFPALWNRLGYTSAGIEIGTGCGAFAEHILTHWKTGLVQCVDPWTTDLPDYDDITVRGPREPDYDLAVAVLSRFPASRVKIVRALSSEALPALVLPVEWVYDDSNHSVEYVRQNLIDYWPIISRGGMYAGHDFGAPDCPGVLQAVVEFAESTGVNVFVTREKSPYKSWYAYKPESWQDEVDSVLRAK